MKNTFLILFFLALEETESFQGVFWHVCDVHYNKYYQPSKNTHFGDYKSDSPFSLIESAFKAMKQLYPNPDFIILNGDNVNHKIVNDSEFTDSITMVSKELYDTFPSTEILPSLGNHDVNPANIFEVRSSWCRSLYEKWARFINKTEEKQTFVKGCYYSRNIASNNTTIKVIMLNTMLWYSVNSHVKNEKDPLDQFQWLESELQKSRRNKTKVFIVGHVPPGASEYSPTIFRHYHPTFNIKFLKIIQSYADIIDAGFFSHQHTDSFKIVYNNEVPVIPLLLSPSISPYYLSGLGSVNPSLRLYFWNDTNTNRRYKQYNTNLINPSDNLKWSLEYDSDSLLPDLSAHYLNELVLDMVKEDSKHFPAFFKHHLSGRPHDILDCSANSSCRCNIVCGIRNIDYTNLDLCLSNCIHKPVSQWVLIASVIIIFTIVLIGIVIGANKVYCRGRRTASLTRDIYLASYNGKNCEDIMSEHIDNIAENTFCDVPEYRGHIRNNSRTILTLNDGNEIVEKSQPSFSKFAVQTKNKSQEKYDYTRM